jgi:glycyl-tRNA synthetase beta chain
VKPFLLEIGVEELPARFIRPAKDGLLRLLSEGLENLRIDHSAITAYGTPRRISVLMDEMDERQRESVAVKFGPPAARAYDAEGKPSQAAIGFARSQGVEVSELKVRKKDEKDATELICVEKIDKGRDTKEILAGFLPDIIARIPFQKKMRWGRGGFEFGRPVHWLVALLGDDIVPFTVAGITSGNLSLGHRFLSNGTIAIKDPASYVDVLRKAYVILKEEERATSMAEDVRSIEARTGTKAVTDEELMDEILYITEYPHGLKGSFEEEYLGLPRAVLVNVMKGHQRYVPLEGDSGNLVNGFIFFANTVPVDAAEVIRGNEKVLRARLADARFFFEEDKGIKLDILYDKLSAVAFHERLGNLKDKAERVSAIGLYLSSVVNLPSRQKVERAAQLIKTDLLTHMVGEFPELQGVMGRIYAGYQGEDSEVARAIEEHYCPVGTNTALPESELGSIMALSDKMDSLIAFFSVGITPTGNLDPFALRRQAIGSIKIIVNKGYHVPLPELFEKGYHALSATGKVAPETMKETLSEFIATRFKFLMVEEGHNQEFVNCILPFVTLDIFDGYMRLRALETQRSIEDFRRLMVGFKRVYNIAKLITEENIVDPSLIQQKEERDLYELYEAKKGVFLTEMCERRYEQAIAVLVGFKETIDNYFDKVFVMVEDEGLKNNRLALLARIKEMFLHYGDFQKIRVEEIA